MMLLIVLSWERPIYLLGNSWIHSHSRGNRLILPDFPIRGMVFKKNSQCLGEFELGEFPDLDTLPVPHREPFFEYLPESQADYVIMTTRGCPYNCAFCYNSSTFLRTRKKDYLRRRSVENVIEELKWAKKKFSPASIWFLDDCFTTDRVWIKSLCELYKDEIGLPFGCMAHPVFIDDDMSRTLSDAGCYIVEMGVQSLSEDVCRRINRMGNRQQVKHALECMKKYGILVAVDHILGLPGDSIELQEESMLFYNENRPFWAYPFWLAYFPKTRITEMAYEEGLLSDEEIRKIELGEVDDYLLGGQIKDKDPYYPIAFFLNWLPHIPKPLMRFLIKSRLYKIFKVKSYFWVVLVPRGLRAMHPKFIRRKYYLISVYNVYRETVKRIFRGIRKKVLREKPA